MQFAEEIATVTKVEDDVVYLKTQQNSACGNCSKKTGCGNVTSFFLFKPRNELTLSNTLDLKVGDKVILGMPVDSLLQATVIMYLLPLVFLLFFAFLGKFFFGELVSVFAGLTSLLVALILIKMLTTRHKTFFSNFEPKLLRKMISLDAA